MISAKDLLYLIVQPACQLVDSGYINKSAIALLMGTVAQESMGGFYLIQTHFYSQPIIAAGGFKGGLGIFQMEKATHDDIIAHYLCTKESLYKQVVNKFGPLDSSKLVNDLLYAAVFCRIHYLRFKEPLPKSYTDIRRLAEYWKKYYNTRLGKGTVEGFIDNYGLVKDTVETWAK